MSSPSLNGRTDDWNVLKIIRWTTGFLGGKGADTPRLDAEVLLADLLGLSRVELYLNFDRPLVREELAAYRERVKRRAAHEPVAYIIGKKEFYSLDFEVGPDVLIPRPETELLVEKALEMAENRWKASTVDIIRVADIGAGSGAISVALAHENPRMRISAVDVSAKALAVAERNAARNGVSDRIGFFQGNLLEPLAGASVKFHLIIANLPYVPRFAFAEMSADVRDYEPHLALDGGDDGFGLIRETIMQAVDLLEAGGGLLLEMWPTHGEKIKALGGEKGYKSVDIIRDLAGRERAAILNT